jgi:S1-C subfamily serine protease
MLKADRRDRLASFPRRILIVVASPPEASSALLGFSNDLAGAVERAGVSVVAVHGRSRLPSSGIHWRSGVVVTADHTLEHDEGITVTLADGKTLPASVAGRDAGTDLAVLKIDASGLPVAEIGDSSSLKIGHIVLAVGRPGDVGLSASWGAISALGPAWRTWAGGQVDQMIRPDLTLYPGFSGGPLIDAQGRVVGVNTSGLSRSLTLAIPTSTINRVTETLLSRGHISRGYLGLAMQPVRLPDSLRSQLSLGNETGLIVVHVELDGPAESAGAFVGDILVSIDGKAVGDTEDVQPLLDADRVGKQLRISVVRGGQLQDLVTTVGERPQKGS